MKQTMIGILLALLLLFTGCGRGTKAMETEAIASYGAASAASREMMPETKSVSEEAFSMTADTVLTYAAPAVTENPSQPDFGGHKIIRNFSLRILSEDFDRHLESILSRCEGFGGYVESSYIHGTKPEVYGDPGRNAELCLRIPKDRVDEFVDCASAYGTLLSRSETAEDVTDSYFDLETRLGVYRTELERLKAILVDTAELSDVLSLEQEISRVTIEIESLTTRLRRYDGLIDYAAVRIVLEEAELKRGPVAKLSPEERIRQGFSEDLLALRSGLENAFVWTVSHLPSLLFGLLVLFVLFAAVRLLFRKLFRRRHKKGENRE